MYRPATWGAAQTTVSDRTSPTAVAKARRSFEDRGYAVLRRALPPATVEELRTVLARLEDPANLPAGEN